MELWVTAIYRQFGLKATVLPNVEDPFTVLVKENGSTELARV